MSVLREPQITVLLKLHALRIHRDQLQDRIDQAVADAQSLGVSHRRIARALGWTPTRVRNRYPQAVTHNQQEAHCGNHID